MEKNLELLRTIIEFLEKMHVSEKHSLKFAFNKNYNEVTTSCSEHLRILKRDKHFIQILWSEKVGIQRFKKFCYYLKYFA